MIVVGERINTFRKRVRRGYEERDENWLRDEALNQAKAGAHVIDINAGADLSIEPDNMRWAVNVIQEVTDLPLAIDSPSPDTILAGFDAVKNKETTWANSITLEKERMERIVPMCAEYQCPVVALCRDEEGLTQEGASRVDVGKKIVDVLLDAGIKLENIYLDSMIEPLSVRTDGGLKSLDTLRGLKEAMPEVKTIISLSGISFSLPERKLLHRVYLPMLMYEKLDSVFLDPLDDKLMTSIIASEALLDIDDMCMNYITAYRDEKLAL